VRDLTRQEASVMDRIDALREELFEMGRDALRSRTRDHIAFDAASRALDAAYYALWSMGQKKHGKKPGSMPAQNYDEPIVAEA
jgi:hypothetical protein